MHLIRLINRIDRTLYEGLSETYSAMVNVAEIGCIDLI